MCSIQKNQGNQLTMTWTCLHVCMWKACTVPLSLCHRLCAFHHVPIFNLCEFVCVCAYLQPTHSSCLHAVTGQGRFLRELAFPLPDNMRRNASVIKAQDTDYIVIFTCFCARRKKWQLVSLILQFLATPTVQLAASPSHWRCCLH